MSDIITYSSKATAKRGILRRVEGLTEDHVEEYDFIEGPNEDGKFSVDLDLVVATIDTLEAYDFTACPACGASFTEDGAVVDGRDLEHSCAACGSEFGEEREKAEESEEDNPVRPDLRGKSSVTGAVNISREIYDNNSDLKRKEAIQKAVDAGVAYYTARTQYQYWFTAQKEKKAQEKDV